ncbi:MAG: hypothetical protein JWM10_341 [Myxococcaceae bacterium]|nr:hypothetical protein [Myxococcaceae bacterium]
MTAAALAAHCDAWPDEVPECPSRDRAPVDLACPLNGQICELPANGQYCSTSLPGPWRCVEHVWRENGSWSCNPPAPTDVPQVRDAGARIDGG